jgi:hypothetical protein
MDDLSEKIDKGLFDLVNTLSRAYPDLTREDLLRHVAHQAGSNAMYHYYNRTGRRAANEGGHDEQI